jgi:hypothetical protein
MIKFCYKRQLYFFIRNYSAKIENIFYIAKTKKNFFITNKFANMLIKKSAHWQIKKLTNQQIG